MNKGFLDEVWVVWENSLQTSKSLSKLPKLKIYIREYQWFTVIQVWEKLSLKKQVWGCCIPYKLKAVDF